MTKGLKGKDLDEVITLFADFLKKKQSLSRFASIAAAFERIQKKNDGVIEASAITARELSGKEKKDIEEAIGKTVELETSINEALIGGLSLRIGNTIIDGSIKSQLTQLKAYLM